MKTTATFRVSERLHFEIIKRLMSPEKFRDFRETGLRAYNSPVELSLTWLFLEQINFLVELIFFHG